MTLTRFYWCKDIEMYHIEGCISFECEHIHHCHRAKKLVGYKEAMEYYKRIRV